MSPRCAQRGRDDPRWRPRGSQGGPKGVPRGSQGGSKGAPDVPQIGPEGPKLAKMRQDEAKRGPEQTNYI